jgi:hypothetical protein
VDELSSDYLLESASQRTGLEDFGPETFREGLEVLLQSAEAEACLSKRGRSTLTAMITTRLVNRLQLYDWHRRYPEIAAETIEAPIFIIGLWRTGTTLLSYVLDKDLDSRSLLRWQAASPCPPPGIDPRADHERIARVAEQIEAQLRDVPELAAINLQEATGPTECVLTLSHEFKNSLWDCSLNIPSYYDWNRSTDQRSAYEHHRKTLQLLQWRQPPTDRWQLKSPGHTLALGSLLEVYPDARFIVSHRDPARSFASACDFWELQMRGFTDITDSVAIARNWVRIYDDSLADLMRFVEAQDPSHIVHLSFSELRDTMGAVEKIYDHFQLPLSEESEGAMREFIDTPRPSNPGGHEYSLERYGFRAAELHERWGDYIKSFDIEVTA